MLTQDIEQQIETAADILRTAQYVTALTGAGISTPSGIPDFRSPSSGMWDSADPMVVASIYGFKQQPDAFYKWVRPLIKLTANAQPNPAHYALRDLEKRGLLKNIITQNIDILHSKAGSETVYEVHGHLRELECLACGVTTAAEAAMLNLAETGEMPTCEACGGLVKPKVILFGEMLPVEILQAAEQAAQLCDVMLVIGSSLEVAPVNRLPHIVKERGAKLILINLGETDIDSVADVVIRADVAQALPAIVSLL